MCNRIAFTQGHRRQYARARPRNPADQEDGATGCQGWRVQQLKPGEQADGELEGGC